MELGDPSEGTLQNFTEMRAVPAARGQVTNLYTSGKQAPHLSFYLYAVGFGADPTNESVLTIQQIGRKSEETAH